MVVTLLCLRVRRQQSNAAKSSKTVFVSSSSADARRFDLTHPKWSLESWLPLMLSRSRWAAGDGDVPNATLVVHSSRRYPRHALSWCRAKVAATERWKRRRGADHWFIAASSRGPCCDGGQPRDPGLLRHHFLGHIGEARDGPWLFREARFADHLLRDSQYRGRAEIFRLARLHGISTS